MADVRCLFAFENQVRPLTCVAHGHACTEIVFNVGGRGTLFHDAQTFAYGPHSVFTYQPNGRHWITQHAEGRHVCLGVQGCDAEKLPIGVFAVSRRLDAWRKGVSALLRKPDARTRLELIAGLVVVDLLEAHGPAAAPASKAQQARAYIDAHYAEAISLEDLAARFFVSADYLRQLFRAEFKAGPIHYLIRKRIDAATELLRFSALPVQEVARQCGFENAFYFSRMYRKVTGRTPSQVSQEYLRSQQPGEPGGGRTLAILSKKKSVR